MRRSDSGLCHRLMAVVALGALGVGAAAQAQTTYAVFAANDLGMHCMQADYSQLMILPPFNTLRAAVIRRGSEPRITTTGVTVSFEVPGNTHSSDKTNFWNYAQQLLGVNLAPDMGLGGFGLSGTMAVNTTRRDFAATGIPITPIDDEGKENPFALGLVTVRNTTTGALIGQTQAVVPVSWEMSCSICHTASGESVATNILKAHDRMHGTHLKASQPVLCAGCHSDNALGLPGQPGVSSLSAAMHTAHAERMPLANLENECYACHPGLRTNCQRDVHAANNVTCHDCHGTMQQVGAATRNPWVDEPRCGTCHVRAGFEFEQTGVLYRDSKGHEGVQCWVCHGSPHAMGPAITATDNVQAIRLQGHAGKIDTCIVCHTSTPSDPFPHRQGD